MKHLLLFEKFSNDLFYHGSDSKFTKFKEQFIKDDGFHGKGFYFATSDLEYGTYLYSVKLDMNKPFEINGYYDIDEIKNILKSKYNADIENIIINDWDYETMSKVGGFVFFQFITNDDLQNAGYDSIIHSDIRVVFKSEQIDIVKVSKSNT